MKLFLLLITLFQVCPVVWPTATLQFKLQSYSNPDHRELDGDCCDDIFGGCDDFCDNYFTVCLDKDSSSGSDFGQCDIMSLSTGIFHDDDDVTFLATIPQGIANPRTMTIAAWPGGMRVKVQVWDYDSTNNDDKVDEDYRNINQAAARTLSSASWKQYTLGHQSVFTFRVRVFCNSNYYSSDCSVSCYPTDNQNGHYYCNSVTGSKICYSGWEGANCNIDADECQSNPCANGAVCVDHTDWYTCQCAVGWTGTNCNVNVDECASNPCKNGGTCHDQVASFSCSCVSGYVYTDEFCEYDDCTPQPCNNNATCIDLTSRFQCICPLGYYGDLCELDTDYCINQTCDNNGTCVDRVDGFHCLCQTGYEGTMCDVEINECSSDPCMHNSTCHDQIGKYKCSCENGYEGVNCEQETDECLSFPCKNNATCLDELDGFYCQCADGFEGVICQSNTDECASFPCYANETCVDEVNSYRCLRVNQCDYSPCRNNATCVDDYPGYICECPEGYGTKTCAVDIDECASSPCLRGTCVDHLNGFSCICHPGFAGVTCHSETNECISSPCEHGICVDQINGFICNCTSGYTGMMCENNTDECASSPCQHGICVDGINEYTCECNVHCVYGHCSNGQCDCDDGYESINCSVQTDYCRSSPCSKGTCIPSLNSYRCECDPLYTGDHCESFIDNPCSLAPCEHGTCKNTNGVTINYECTCKPDFYGTNCDADIKLNGATIMITGKLENPSEFESKMASLLQKLKTSSARYARDTKSETVSVEVIMVEDYSKSSDGGTLTRVTFIAWTNVGYFSKGYIEDLIAGASPRLITELGYEIYSGKAQPVTGGKPDETWIGSHWYVLLILATVVVLVVAGGYIVWRRGYTSFGKDLFKAPRRPNGLPTLDPPEAAYSTRIINDFTTLTADTPRCNISTAESINPAYIPSCVDQLDERSGGCDGAQGEAGVRLCNIYAEIPAWKAKAVETENPYHEIKH